MNRSAETLFDVSDEAIRGQRLQGLPFSCFDSEWRKASSIKRCGINDVRGFWMAHYLRKPPAVVRLVLQLSVRSCPVGVVIYAEPPPETKVRYGGETWELARLYLVDQLPRNAETFLIGQSIKWIKKNHRDVRYLVSYADPAFGHKGTIYRASNWIPDGMTDDERKTPRVEYVDSTGKSYGRKGNVPPGVKVEARPRVSKHRFYYKLK